MSLGYWAGRTRRFDADQTRGLNDLVMTFALPSLMFVATVTTTRSEMLAEARFSLAILIAFLGLYVAVVLFSMCILLHNVGAAGLQAFLVTFPSVAFFGIPIFKGLFGEGSLLSITTADVLASITIAPLTIVLLEIHAAFHRWQCQSDRGAGAKRADQQRHQANGVGTAAGSILCAPQHRLSSRN